MAADRLRTPLMGLLLVLLLAATARAQPPGDPETDISSFREKEADLITLIDQQLPQLERLSSGLTEVATALKAWEDTLRYRDKVPIYRDKALRDVASLRRRTDQAYEELKELNMQWYPFQRDLQAVYTRYGELIVVKKVDDHLRGFLLMHRKVLARMDDVLLQVSNNRIQSDFLLNSKLK